MNPVVASLIVFGFGVVLGVRNFSSHITDNKHTILFRCLFMIVPGIFILGFSYGIDIIMHSLFPDTCVFGIVNCLLTFVFYGTAAHYFFYLAFKKAHYYLFKPFTSLWDKIKLLHYPLLAMLIVLQFHSVQTQNPAAMETMQPGVHSIGQYLLQLLPYVAGVVTGIMVKRYVFEQRFFRFVGSCLLFLIIFGCFGYQLAAFVRFNLLAGQLSVVKFASGLTIILIGFHMLYLNVYSDKPTQQNNEVVA